MARFCVENSSIVTVAIYDGKMNNEVSGSPNYKLCIVSRPVTLYILVSGAVLLHLYYFTVH